MAPKKTETKSTEAKAPSKPHGPTYQVCDAFCTWFETRMSLLTNCFQAMIIDAIIAVISPRFFCRVGSGVGATPPDRSRMRQS
jgi:hypothetical protein